MYGPVAGSVVAAGAFIASITSGWNSAASGATDRASSGQSRGVGPAAIAVAGLVRVPVLVMLALLFAGAADMILGCLRPRSRPPLRPTIKRRSRESGDRVRGVTPGGPILGETLKRASVGGTRGVPVRDRVGTVLRALVAAAVFRARRGAWLRAAYESRRED